MGKRLAENCAETCDLLVDAVLKLQVVKQKVFWLLKTRQRQQALHYVEHLCEAEDLRDLTLIMEDYCMSLMKEIRILKGRRGFSDEAKKARAGFHLIATRCKALSCMQDIDRALIIRLGCDPCCRHPVEPHVLRKLLPRPPSEERREQLLEEIWRERGVPTPDVGSASPEIIESCKICCNVAPTRSATRSPSPSRPAFEECQL
ncbi:unnamed protein product [Spirodela intermedia]|uniref:Uncharacterized protein n=1 Tax=Spirodela intermedia TaxID=51605 RepID=A0A7I8JNA6_SPIIN|nr:unnamed protein product [Spirodela intermedia]CAA6671275.1 unnamed protein product [Spirodela intermedia]